MRRPLTSEPVKLIFATSGCSTRAEPTSAPKPVTTLKTPSGSPASLVKSANSSVLTEANSDGFTTTEQPAASAGAHFIAQNIKGEFHAVMTATTPTGSRSVSASISAFSTGTTTPSTLSAKPAY